MIEGDSYIIIFCIDEEKHCLPINKKNLSYIEITTRYSKVYYHFPYTFFIYLLHYILTFGKPV